MRLMSDPVLGGSGLKNYVFINYAALGKLLHVSVFNYF